MILQGVDSSTQASFTLRNRAARALWNFVWTIFFRLSPRPLHSWRSWLLRAFGATVGRGVHVYPDVQIWAPWLLELGDEVGIGNGVRIYNMAETKIGRRCVISQGAHLCAGSRDIDSPNFQLVAAPIVLEPQVWICAEAFVGPGVRIAEGCVLGARAVLFKDAKESWTVWIGNPARPGRKRKQTAVR